MQETYFMKEAIKEARQALAEGNWPIGCILELNGKIIARGHNIKYSQKKLFGHAEMQALQEANDILNEHPNEVTLYTTYEPCLMCFGACIFGNIKKVVCGIDLDQSGAMHLRHHLPHRYMQNNNQIEFERGLLANECAEVFLKGEPTKKLIKAGFVRINDDPGKTLSQEKQEL